MNIPDNPFDCDTMFRDLHLTVIMENHEMTIDNPFYHEAMLRDIPLTPHPQTGEMTVNIGPVLDEDPDEDDPKEIYLFNAVSEYFIAVAVYSTGYRLQYQRYDGMSLHLKTGKTLADVVGEMPRHVQEHVWEDPSVIAFQAWREKSVSQMNPSTPTLP